MGAMVTKLAMTLKSPRPDLNFGLFQNTGRPAAAQPRRSR